MTQMIKTFFEIDERDSTIRTEVVGGLTTFVTMAYIVAVNPGMLSQALGQDLFGELLFATCVSSAIATLIMGIGANYPFALAPGMGLNAMFTFTVVIGMGVRWDLALGVVLASGLIFTALSILRIREVLINAVPTSLKHATAAGIGLFIAFIGLQNAGIVGANEATLVGLGNVRGPEAGLALLGLLGTGILIARGVKGAILFGVGAVTVLAMATGYTPLPAGVISAPVWPERLLGVAVEQLPAAFDVALIELVFVFLFVDLFDTMGTLVGLSQRSGLLDHKGHLPRANRALLADSLGTVGGALLGTSPVTTYIESASGITEGARTGLASVVVALLFLAALFFTPLVASIPLFATAPALVIVGVLMMSAVKRIDWDDPSDALPAFLTLLIMPLTFSIANGVAAGIVAYPIVKRLSGKGKEVHSLLDVLAVLFLARYIFMD